MTRSVLVACLALSACGGPLQPAGLRLGEDACAYCRMTVVSDRTAAQIVTPGGEPLIFDELECLRDYLAAKPPGDDAVVFVVDHRTRAWLDARQAVFTRTGAATPMGSGLVAHANPASRDADPVGHGVAVAPELILRPPAAVVTP